MSRIGKKPIIVPKEVEVKFDGGILSVKGPKGELSRFIHPKVELNINNSQILLLISDNSKESKSLFGLFRSLIANMVLGVNEGFNKTLEIIGVGYKVELSGNQLIFNLGYSNPITYDIPKGIKVQLDQRNKVILSGIDKELLGITAAKIRSFRTPEPYKGKGIKYLEERVKRKAGKTGAKA
ncbi:MAG: 50S ribosomal protein L6 [Deltaproteobacteria bacterium]|jgi:large subunit ribosomal protein L6|nr:MAG: 50S ribosomal protein L6 [Deltaproteobacteria bacterium]